MNDGSRKVKSSGLRNEWSILIQSFVEDDIESRHTVINQLKEQGLTFEDFQKYSKHLSQQRKSINNQIEDLKNQIDDRYQTIENLILVKSDTTEVLQEIEDLNALGEKLSKQMEQVDQKSKALRRAEALFLARADEYL